MATIFVNLTKKLFEGEKVFSHKIICIFGSGLTVCVLLKVVKRVSSNWAMTLHLIYLHYKTTTVKKIRLKFLGYSP